MWTIERNHLNRQVEQYRVLDGPNPLTFERVIDLWRSDHTQSNAFRMFTSLMLASSPFQAFRWETPVVDRARLDREFEFVLVDSPGLNRQEDSQPFDPQLNSAAGGSLAAQAGGSLIGFRNLNEVRPIRSPCSRLTSVAISDALSLQTVIAFTGPSACMVLVNS